MLETAEPAAFLQRILSLPSGPGVSLDAALRPSLDDEAELRRLFMSDKTNSRLSDPRVGLVDVFKAPPNIRTTRARVVKDDVDLSGQYIMPLSETKRRKEGDPAMAADLDEFKRSWSIFTENSLSQLFDWNNVVAAGGAVLACLTPLPESAKVSKRAIRKYFHSVAYPTSDVDLFLWGLTPEQAETKVNTIYEAVRDSVPWDVTCVRTKHTISIYLIVSAFLPTKLNSVTGYYPAAQYPYRSIQIVLRLYSSPAEILAGFDIDSPCCAYDGDRVWANPRAIVAMMRQCNTVDVSRRSPSYEIRLAKYSSRDFEVYVPDLKRDSVDPTIFERSIVRIEGLARLLVLEKLTNSDKRQQFLQSRRDLRGRPRIPTAHRKRMRKYKGDLKQDTSIGGLEMNDYDVASLHIPYGPGWDARRIDKLVYQTDLGMNSTFNPKNKGRRLHRHPAFVGTMPECIEDCCELCPEPKNEDEKKLQEDEDKQYIRGRIAFIEENPGRQIMSGSFNPIDVGEWSGQAYICPTEKFFAAIVAGDRVAVAKSIVDGIDINRRDHVGRTALHLAILVKAVDVACDLVDAGARITARLVDGRTALHLAAQLDLAVVLRKLLQRSAINEDRVAKSGLKKQEIGSPGDGSEIGHEPTRERKEDDEPERPSSEDDWSSEEPDGPAKKAPVAKKVSTAAASESGDMPEDDNDLPDVLDINAADWDHAFTPLSYAVLYGSLPVIEELLTAGADVKLVAQSRGYNLPPVHPLLLTILTEDEGHACKVAERLLLAGATSSTADDNMRTTFYRVVCSKRMKLASTILRSDPNAKAVINFPSVSYDAVNFPLVAALVGGNYSMIALLLAHGAKVVYTEEDVSRAKSAPSDNHLRYHYANGGNWMSDVRTPVETAIALRQDTIFLLVALGADVNVGLKRGVGERYYKECYLSVMEWVQLAIISLTNSISDADTDTDLPPKRDPQPKARDWKGFHDMLSQDIKAIRAQQIPPSNPKDTTKSLHAMNEIREYLRDVEDILLSQEAQTWDQIYPDRKSDPGTGQLLRQPPAPTSPFVHPSKYFYTSSHYSKMYTPRHLVALYDELYEACFSGDNEKIQQLCLPPEESTSQPLQISVEHPLPGVQYGGGYSPLFVAINSRHWETARLILAIAVAQYRPEDHDIEFSTKDLVLDDDSDNESEASCVSDDTVEQQNVINFIDIAKRPTKIQCQIPPRKLLCEVISEWPADDQKAVSSGNLIQKAIADDDLEAFVHIADLYKTISEPLLATDSILESILSSDRAEMLDELIRRTGCGVDVVAASSDAEDAPVLQDKYAIYLGLNYHGKKRKDLAKKNDPNAVQEELAVIPLLWKAAQAHAHNIVRYLSADRPLAAYRFYLSTNSDDRAELLRRTRNLDTVLPEWLGWFISPLKESPLTSAVLGHDLETVQILFEKAPRFTASALHEPVKFLGYNVLMLCADRGCSTELFDYLLAKGVSPLQTDIPRNWNIFHLICFYGHNDLLAHLLDKLPSDTSEALLAQQSKSTLDTPLHLAVNGGRIRTVKLILEFRKLDLLLTNVNGHTALHIAVQQGYAELARLLIDASPAVVLCMENGVGEVPLETATQQELLWRTRIKFNQDLPYFNDLSHSAVSMAPVRFPPGTESEIANLNVTLGELVLDGRLKQNTKITTALFTFAQTLKAKFNASRPPPKGPEPKELKDPKDEIHRELTLKYVRDGVSKCSDVRQLVHLLDAQKSVQSDLPQRDESLSSRPFYNKDEDGYEPEEDVEQAQRRKSLVFSLITTGR